MSDPTIAPACTCAAMCPELEGAGCCDCCGGYGQDASCWGMCWDCRGTGHPHPLEDPDCPEHRMTDGPGPASSPDAVTVYCPECEGPSDIIKSGLEEDVLGQQWWVDRLDCGHDQTYRR